MLNDKGFSAVVEEQWKQNTQAVRRAEWLTWQIKTPLFLLALTETNVPLYLFDEGVFFLFFFFFVFRFGEKLCPYY